MTHRVGNKGKESVGKLLWSRTFIFTLRLSKQWSLGRKERVELGRRAFLRREGRKSQGREGEGWFGLLQRTLPVVWLQVETGLKQQQGQLLFMRASCASGPEEEAFHAFL